MVRSLEQVPEDTLEHFRESAEALITQHGATKALSAALAVLSGSTEIKTRSLITSKEVRKYAIMKYQPVLGPLIGVSSHLQSGHRMGIVVSAGSVDLWWT